MSIQKNTSLPDTLRTLVRNSDEYKDTTSLFFSDVDFSFTTDEIIDIDSWYENLGVNIFPLHGVTSFNDESRKTAFKESEQDFEFKTVPGKYKHKFGFDWSLDYRNLIAELSGQKLNVYYISGRVIRGVEKEDGTIRGFETSLINIEDILFPSGGNSGTSEVLIQLNDVNELNETGYEVEVDWEPGKLDRLALNIGLTFGETSITLLLKHLNNNITGVEASDITITDDINGDIGFTTFVPGDGVYQLSGFSDTITTACIYIQSTIYIGAKRFSYVYRVIVINNMLFADGNNVVLANGENVVLAKN